MKSLLTKSLRKQTPMKIKRYHMTLKNNKYLHMKSTLLTLFSIIVMLTSCKCKKAVTETAVKPEMAMDSANATLVTTNNVEEATLQPTVSNEAQVVKQESGTLLEYTANTRGYHLRVKWDGSQLSYTNQRDSEELTKVTLTKAQSEELNTMIKNLPLEKLAGLKAPTEKRQYDGAAHADMRVVVDGKEYNSAGFDHGFPPAEIEKFVKKLVSYAEQK